MKLHTFRSAVITALVLASLLLAGGSAAQEDVERCMDACIATEETCVDACPEDAEGDACVEDCEARSDACMDVCDDAG